RSTNSPSLCHHSSLHHLRRPRRVLFQLGSAKWAEPPSSEFKSHIREWAVIADMFMMGLLMLESSNRSPLSCASCRAGQIPALVAPVAAPRNGEGGMLRKSAVAAVVMLFALPALAQNPPTAPPVRVRGTIEKVDGANLTVKARDGMDVKVAV